MMPWRNAAAVLMLSGALALQTGCGDMARNRGDIGTAPGAKAETDNRQGIGQLSMRSANGGAARVGSDQLIRVAEQVPGVDHAMMAISGNKVVVGIQVENQDKRKIAEKQVVSQLLWQYPEYNYYVTSETELVDRVRAASEQQTAGPYRTRSVATDDEIAAIADEISRMSVRP